VTSTVITTVLAANRGEIARRIFRTCRRAGIGCVAVFSDPDAGAPHAAEADAAVRLPGSSPADTYLNGPALVAAALAAGADAVHPGYGFLSEDAGFARAVQAAGLTWIGPPPDAIEAMGSKITSKKLAAEAGVPVLPELSPGTVRDYPVLVKASAGGGGRGMRVVRNAGELEAALESARREAQSAFGDSAVFCEPLLTGARHVEVQVLADAHGTVWTLAERDCSVQRRYQKVIEETPSPAVGEPVRARLLAAAEAVTRAVGYLGAGTAEFLVTADGQFYFLEFNTRLQVEHPVTECVHGIDLVALQFDIARGVALPRRPPPAAGHAIEARLYAEDPADGYRPSTGPLYALDIPDVATRFGPPAAGPATAGTAAGLRLDSGVEAGSEISPHYDPMLAKLIAWAPGRETAARLLASALDRARIHGPATNRDLLTSVLRHPGFLGGQAGTSWLDGYDLAGLVPSEQACWLAAVAAALTGATVNRAAARAAAGLPGGWRNVVSQPQRTAFDGPRGRVEVGYVWRRDGLLAVRDEGVAVVGAAPDHAALEVAGVRYRFDVARAGEVVWVDSAFGHVALAAVPRLPKPAAIRAPGSLVAPMPGSVVRVETEAGRRVSAGQPVLVLEAMKMEHQVVAPSDGLVAEIRVAPGDQVQAGDVLATVTGEEAETRQETGTGEHAASGEDTVSS
jgi:propionyl-CoA carboxylase alpha chain